MHKKS